jgi:pilus assembly protein CpaF
MSPQERSEMSFDLILPFLRPIAHLIEDPTVSEIMVNGSQKLFIERDGIVQPVPGVTLDERYLKVAVKNIARLLGDDVSEETPILDARLPDGSRVAAVFPPCSLGGTTLTIRKFHSRLWACQELVCVGMITEDLVRLVRSALANRDNILISGGTGTGKTTLLNALAALLPESDRIVLIEDTAELTIAHPNLVRFEARRKQPDAPAVTIRDLLKATLRHRPDRIIVGEVRGGEAFDLLQTLNTGHSGSLSTIHANSAEQALVRFASCVLQSGVDLPYAAIRRLIGESIDVVLHLERRRGVRSVTETIRVAGYAPERDVYAVEVLTCQAGAPRAART